MEKDSNKKAVLFQKQLLQARNTRLLLVSEHLLALNSFGPSVVLHCSSDDRQ